MEERKRNKPLEILNKYKFVLLAAALGAALLLWPAGPGGLEVQTEASQTGIKAQDARETEAAMEKILAEISGVGRVDVMLTLHSGSELVLAEDAALRYSGSAQSPDNYERSTDTVTTWWSGRRSTPSTGARWWSAMAAIATGYAWRSSTR